MVRDIVPPPGIPFVVYHEYSDHSGGAEIIYVGYDKTKAFDALINFLHTSFRGCTDIKIKASEG